MGTLAAQAQTPSEAEDRRIIDVHLHALPPSFFPEQADTAIGYERPESAEAVMRQTMVQLERFGVEKAVTSGDPELLEKYKQAAPGRIIRSLWVPIGLTGDSLHAYLDSISHWHEEGRFQVIGEVLTQYSGIVPNDSILDPLWAFAEREGVPVGIHDFSVHRDSVSDATPQYRLRYGDLPAMKEVLAEHPDLKVYIMHAGYPLLEEMVSLLSAHPQVYVGVSALPLFLTRAEAHRYLKGLVQAGFADRIMFGSDQMIWPQSYEASVEAIESADFLSEEQKRAIFYENAARFLEIGGESSGDS